MGGPPEGRLSENDPEEDCRESEPLGVKEMEGLLLGVRDVELINGGTVISAAEEEEEDDDDADDEEEEDVCCPWLTPAVGGTAMYDCRSSSWNVRKLAMLASSSEIDCFLRGGCKASPSEPECDTKESLRFLVNM
jgi:hypothetical protein